MRLLRKIELGIFNLWNIIDGILWVITDAEECFFVRRYKWQYTPNWQEIHRQISKIRRLQNGRKIYCQKIIIGVSSVEASFVSIRNIETKRVQK